MSGTNGPEASAILDGKWSEGQGLHVDGIVYRDGRIILCDCRKIKVGKSMSTRVSPFGETTLSSILKYNDDPWVELTETGRCELKEKDLVLSCGEGAMGNEGYVAVSE